MKETLEVAVQKFEVEVEEKGECKYYDIYQLKTGDWLYIERPKEKYGK